MRRAAKLRNADVQVVEIDAAGGVARSMAGRRADDGLLEGVRRRRARRSRWCDRSRGPARRRISASVRRRSSSQRRQADGIVTAPLSKAALHAAGHFYPGHTELLAELCGVEDFAMMLYLPPGAAVRWPGRARRRPRDAAPIAAERVRRSEHRGDRREVPAGRSRDAAAGRRRSRGWRWRRSIRTRGEEGLFGDEEQDDHRARRSRSARGAASTWPARFRPTR